MPFHVQSSRSNISKQLCCNSFFSFFSIIESFPFFLSSLVPLPFSPTFNFSIINGHSSLSPREKEREREINSLPRKSIIPARAVSSASSASFSFASKISRRLPEDSFGIKCTRQVLAEIEDEKRLQFVIETGKRARRAQVGRAASWRGIGLPATLFVRRGGLRSTRAGLRRNEHSKHDQRVHS